MIFIVEYSTSFELPTLLHINVGSVRSIHSVPGSQSIWRTSGDEFLRCTIEISCGLFNCSIGIDIIDYAEQVRAVKMIRIWATLLYDS